VLGASTAPQVVLLGAGLDSRAWRLDWPAGTTVWELDRPEVLDVKAAVVTGPPACDRRPVAVDLLDDWPAALAAAGHDPAVPTTWVAEGLLVYFDDAGVDRLLRRVTALSPAGSRLVLTLRVSDRALPHLADVWRSRAPADPVAWMAGHGVCVVLLVAGIVLWVGASAAGVVENVESFFQDAGFDGFKFSAGVMLRGFAVGGLILVVAGTIANLLLATLFNLMSDVVGGIRVTLGEDLRRKR
jgi:hypothetical protein